MASHPFWRYRFGQVLTLLVCLSVLLLAPTGAVAQRKVQLRFVVWDGDEALRILRAEVEAFERAHPHIDVKLENVDYKAYFQKLLAQYAANVAPDVAMMDPANFQKFAKRGAFTPLNDLYGQTNGFNIDDYYEPIVEAMSYRGQSFVLPRDIAPIALVFYNKKAFDEAGIPYPDGTWTWDFKVRPELREKDFLWVLQQLTKKNERGKPVRWGLAPDWNGILVDLFSFSQGARYADDPERPTKLLYTDPRVVKAHQFAADLCLKFRFVPSQAEMTSVAQSTAVQLFIDQKVAMYACGIWNVPKIRESLKPGSKNFFEWDIALAPAFRDGTRAYPTGGSGYAMLSSTKHKEEAWLLMQWMAGEPGMMAMAKAGIAQPAIRELALREPWIPGPNTPKDQLYPRNRIVTDKAVPYVVFSPTADYWPEVSLLATAPTEPVFVGNRDAQSALNEGVAVGQRRLDVILREQTLPPFNWSGGILIGLGLVVGLVAWVYLPERRQKFTSQERAESRTAYIFLAPWLVGIFLFTLGPMVVSLLMSFADWDIIQPAKWRALTNYKEAFFEDPRFWVSLRATGMYTLFAVPLGLIGSLALALLLNTKVKGIALYRTCFYLPALASTVAASLIWRKIFQPEGGLLNSLIYGSEGDRNLLGLGSALEQFGKSGEPANWLGNEHLALPALVIMSLWGIGGGMVILLAGLQGIPQFYYEAATLDGANAWQRFRAVTLPLVSPSLFFVLITGMIGSFQVFTQAFVMTEGGPNNATRFFMLHLYDAAFGSLRMGYASALAWVLFVIILVFTLLQFRLNKKIYYEADLR